MILRSGVCVRPCCSADFIAGNELNDDTLLDFNDELQSTAAIISDSSHLHICIEKKPSPTRVQSLRILHQIIYFNIHRDNVWLLRQQPPRPCGSHSGDNSYEDPLRGGFLSRNLPTFIPMCIYPLLLPAGSQKSSFIPSGAPASGANCRRLFHFGLVLIKKLLHCP